MKKQDLAVAAYLVAAFAMMIINWTMIRIRKTIAPTIRSPPPT